MAEARLIANTSMAIRSTPRKRRAAQVARGVRLLDAYLRRTGQTVRSFSISNRLDVSTVLRVANGQIRRVSVDFALDVATATRNEVPVDAWRLSRPRAVESPSECEVAS